MLRNVSWYNNIIACDVEVVLITIDNYSYYNICSPNVIYITIM